MGSGGSEDLVSGELGSGGLGQERWGPRLRHPGLGRGSWGPESESWSRGGWSWSRRGGVRGFGAERVGV